MRAVLILVAAILTMACGDAGPVGAGRGDGTIAASLTLGDLTPAEREMVDERFGHDFIEARSIGLAPDALFGFDRCELNSSAPAELIAIGRSPTHCTGVEFGGAAVCGVWALAPTADGWVQVLESAGVARLAPTTTNGWRDFVLERGGPPAVYKFAGVVYQEDVGEFDLSPDALEGWSQDGIDPLSVIWLAFDDPMPPAAEAVFLTFYTTEFLGDGGRMAVLPDAFRIGLAELDGTAPEEVIVQGASAAFCKPDGCRHWIFRAEDPPREIGVVDGFDLQVAITRESGMRDIVVAGEVGLFVWRFNGARYVLPGAR